jgi:hypothetical protein
MGTGGLQSARAWAEEAEERQMRQQEEDVGGRWRRAKVEATAKRAVASTRQEVVRREEEGLRLAEELSEDRLLVALETLELAAAAGRAQAQRNLERKTRLTLDEQLELRVLRRHAACLESLRRFEATAEAEDGCVRPPTPLGGVPARRRRQRGAGAAPRRWRLPGGGRRRRWGAEQVALYVAARLPA